MLGQITQNELTEIKTILKKIDEPVYFRIETIPEKKIIIHYKKTRVEKQFKNIEEFKKYYGRQTTESNSSTTFGQTFRRFTDFIKGQFTDEVEE